ncbi:MAG: glucose-1-phosphate cytidylyltransferase [Oligoflexia bacterium]|nr:glucose-1-phosphate cytidylyltransferase [Oligoflexia bacterium]
MKTVLLCGGLGTRLGEKTTLMPKPLVEVGEHPILWHIMNIYSYHGFNDFVLALGYKGKAIKDYFLNFHALNNNLEINLQNGAIKHFENLSQDWRVSLVDTGENTMTGGRLLRLRSYLEKEEIFMLTYGDGVANVDIKKLVEFHIRHKRIATLTIVRPPSRFGVMHFDGDRVISFQEKPQTEDGWINGGFFVFRREVFDYLDNDITILERKPLERLAADGQLMAYRHSDFWQCMDTMRDKNFLNEIWNSGDAPWFNKGMVNKDNRSNRNVTAEEKSAPTFITANPEKEKFNVL